MPLPNYANTLYSYALSHLQNQIQQAKQEALAKQEQQWQQVQRIQDTGSRMVEMQGKELDRRRAFLQEANKASAQLGMGPVEGTEPETTEYGALGSLQGMAAEQQRREQEAFKQELVRLQSQGKRTLQEDKAADIATQKTIDFQRSLDKMVLDGIITEDQKKSLWDYMLPGRRSIAALGASRTAANKALENQEKLFDSTKAMVSNLNGLSDKLQAGGASIFVPPQLLKNIVTDQSGYTKGVIASAVTTAANSLSLVTGRNPTQGDINAAVDEAMNTLNAGMAEAKMSTQQKALFEAAVRQMLRSAISGKGPSSTKTGVAPQSRPTSTEESVLP